MTTQVSIFDGNEDFIIDKPIRLIECFAGYGSQHLALKYLGAKVESYRICEWAVKSIQAYKDLHFPDDNTDYSANLTMDEVIDYLANKGISANYNNPMTRDQVKRMGEAKCRQVYNNIKATHNLVNIMQANASDLNIVERDKYCYVMTYSFPCQDLSKAGLGKGMAKDSGTRSGLLWEVERLLDECNGNLPQVLLMENVPDVIGTKNIKPFAKWLEKLESIGYKCYWKVLNGKDYGIPQNRERCFMVSILGDYFYGFPQGIKLEKRLKHLLETQVDEKFYLSDVALKGLQNIAQETPRCIQAGILSGGKWDKMHDISRRYYDTNGLAPTMHTCGGGNLEPKIVEPQTCAMRGRYTTADAHSRQQLEIGGTNANCITTVQKDSMVVEPIAFDEQNQYFRKDGCVGTLTTDGSSPKHNNREVEPRLVGGVGEINFGTQYRQGNRIYDANAISMCLNASPLGNAGGYSYLYQLNNYRIRKLTPKECWRLMGVKDKDFERVAANQSNSSLYHLAGDSIITTVLMAIFSSMVGVDWRKCL